MRQQYFDTAELFPYLLQKFLECVCVCWIAPILIAYSKVNSPYLVLRLKWIRVHQAKGSILPLIKPISRDAMSLQLKCLSVRGGIPALI